MWGTPRICFGSFAVLYSAPIADIIRRHNLQYHIFADDIQLHISFKLDSYQDLQSAKVKVQLCVWDIECWMVHNGLKLNQDKTELLVISSKYRFMPNLDFVQVGVERIEPKSTVRNLGVVMDQFFNADHHITAICKTSQYHLTNVTRNRKHLDEASTETLVHAFVSSILDHCNVLIHGLPKYQLNRLQLVLNTAARVVTCTRKYDHIKPVLIKLHWLPVYYRVLFKVLLLVFKAFNGLAPHYVSDLLNKRVSVHSLRSNSQELLNIPRSRTKTYGDRAFSVAGPRQWNELPLDIRTISDVNAFKRSLKTYLFRYLGKHVFLLYYYYHYYCNRTF